MENILVTGAEGGGAEGRGGAGGEHVSIHKLTVESLQHGRSQKVVCGEASEAQGGQVACSPRNVWNLEALTSSFIQVMIFQS